jgi:phosphatidylglycerophosphatase A
VKKTLVLSLATSFGLGYSRWAPGTAGSLPGFVLVVLFANFSALEQIVLILLSFFFGVWISKLSLSYFHEKDPKQVTIDEMVSLPITFFLIPLTPFALILGFLLNRALDILKPRPAYQSQSLPHGWGIMTDDLISAIYSNLLLRFILIFIE